MSQNSNSILIVEDDLDLGNILAEYLRLKDHEVELATSAENATPLLEKNWSIIILDVSLPGQSGFELAETLKKKGIRTPFIFLTAKGQKKDRLKGLGLGADDYITKPFEVEELLLRIKNILRRTGQVNNLLRQVDNLTLDAENMRLTVGEKAFELTEKETRLLELFIENQGKLLKRAFILKQIWGDDDYFNGRSMDVFISRIRKYLSGTKSLSLVNVRGVGFRLENK